MARVRGEQEAATMVAQGLELGRDVYIGRPVLFDPGFLWLISIGDETTITPGVTILAHDASSKLRTGYSLVAPVRIGRRVFIGACSLILPGVTVGDDAIIGAGSVVARDVPAGSVAAGNPAGVVGSVEDHTRRHMQALSARPRYPRAGFTAIGGAPPANRRRMQDELADGPGYVE
jgi:maltose O-acetyltransferase